MDIDRLPVPAMGGECAVVVGGGDASSAFLSILQRSPLTVAADSGALLLEALGVVPQVLVGDFDSAGEAVVGRMEKSGSRVVRLPVEKDVTDMEAALAIVLDGGYRKVLVLGALGGDRVEHAVANLCMIEYFAKKGLDVALLSERSSVVHLAGPSGLTHRAVSGRAGDWISLLPVSQTAGGVTTQGLKYPLQGATLHRGSTLGVSNQMLGSEAAVSIDDGFLLLIHTLG